MGDTPYSMDDYEIVEIYIDDFMEVLRNQRFTYGDTAKFESYIQGHLKYKFVDESSMTIYFIKFFGDINDVYNWELKGEFELAELSNIYSFNYD